jgi:hypothetical protein
MPNIPNAAMTGWIAVAVGLLLLFFGRKLFWFFVGAIGFVAGLQIATRLVGGQSEAVLLVIALGLGLIGAVLAIVLQRIAVAVAGWIAGGYLAWRFAQASGWDDQATIWILVVAGAIAAAIVVSLLFGWALIILSAATGAIIVSDVLPWGQPVQFIAAAALFVIGAAAQARGRLGVQPRRQQASD